MKKFLSVSLVWVLVLVFASSSWATWYIYVDNMNDNHSTNLDGKVGDEYNIAFRYGGWTAPYYTNWSYTGNFPDGLTFDGIGSNGPAFLKGTATKAGTFTVTLSLYDSRGSNGTATPTSFTFHITGGSSGGSGNSGNSNDSGSLGSSGGGGCETGFGIFGLTILGTALMFKRSK